MKYILETYFQTLGRKCERTQDFQMLQNIKTSCFLSTQNTTQRYIKTSLKLRTDLQKAVMTREPDF